MKPLKMLPRHALSLLMAVVPCGSVFAQVPVIDEATLSQATKTASNTAQIMSSNSDILQTVNRTLAAVTGNRSTSEIAGAALGSGFSIGNAPDFPHCSAVRCPGAILVPSAIRPQRS